MPFLSLLSNSYTSFKTQLMCHCPSVWAALLYGQPFCASLASGSCLCHSTYEKAIYMFKACHWTSVSQGKAL